MSADLLRVIIADDHPLVRSGLRTVLSTGPGIEVVGEASTGSEAVALAGSLPVDVVVMDLQMPELNGIDATRQIVAAHPQVAVLVLTMFEDDASVFAAMRAPSATCSKGPSRTRSGVRSTRRPTVRRSSAPPSPDGWSTTWPPASAPVPFPS